MDKKYHLPEEYRNKVGNYFVKRAENAWDLINTKNTQKFHLSKFDLPNSKYEVNIKIYPVDEYSKLGK